MPKKKKLNKNAEYNFTISQVAQNKNMQKG